MKRGRPKKSALTSDNELMEDPRSHASIEVDMRWACRMVCKYISDGISEPDAIAKAAKERNIYESLGEKRSCWLKPGPRDIYEFLCEFQRRPAFNVNEEANKNLTAIIEEVAEKHGMSFNTLQNFHKFERYRLTSKITKLADFFTDDF
jgi:hypothetical protein